MKVEALLLIFVGIFFGIIGLIYWALTSLTAYPEEAGFLMLIGTFLLGVVPGSYYMYWHQRWKGKKYMFFGKLDTAVGMRPEDRPDASIAEGAGTIDSFPNSSIWPFCLGMGAFLLVNGLVFGWWLCYPGIALVLIALTGVTAESRRGGTV